MLGFFFIAMGGLALSSLFIDDDVQSSPGTESDENGETGVGPVDGEEPHLNLLDQIVIDETLDLVEGTAGNDSVYVSMGLADTGEHFVQNTGNGSLFLGGVEEAERVELDTGAGNDEIIVESGNAITLVTGPGNDTVDAGGLQSGLIYAGQGDLVQGSDVDLGTYPKVGVSMNGGIFEGGSAGELAVAHGSSTGAILSGGGGDDYLFAHGGDVHLSGGDGDDFLSGRANSSEYCECTRTANVYSYSNSSQDTLLGGAGNDHLELSNGDFGYGGEGSDSFEIVHSSTRGLDAATIGDFTQSEDTLLIEVGGGDAWDYTDSSYDLSNRVEVEEMDGNTTILVDSEVVAHIEGATELTIGIPFFPPLDSDGSNLAFVDYQNGEIGDRDDFDVIVSVFYTRSS